MTRPFSVGAVLAASGRLWSRRLVAFVVLTALPHVPNAVLFWGELSSPRWWHGSTAAMIPTAALAWSGGALIAAAGLSRGAVTALRRRGARLRPLLAIHA